MSFEATVFMVAFLHLFLKCTPNSFLCVICYLRLIYRPRTRKELHHESRGFNNIFSQRNRQERLAEILSEQINEDGPAITTEVSPYIIPEVALIKKFRFYLDDETGQAIASAFVFFVNSDLFFKRKFPLEQLAKDRRMQKVVFDSRMLGWFQTGTNFVFFEDIYVFSSSKG